MAIKKMSSQEYNNILSNATNKIENISQEMKDIKNDIYKKVRIIQFEQEWLSMQYDKMTNSNPAEETYVFLNAGKHNGLYNTYGNVTHAYFKQAPINVFNLKVVNGTESYFRDEVKVNINGIEDDYFKNILKADDVKDKELFFEEYDFNSELKVLEDKSVIKNNNNISTITIEVDKSKAIGISKFNVIELDPYLYRSFDIRAIDIYTDDSETPALTLNNIENIGKTRFVLDKKYEFKKVVFQVIHNFCSVAVGRDTYPFGIKHLFFLDADFRSDSYIIIEYASNNYINDIKDRVDVITPLGKRLSSLSEEGIKVYLSNNNGMLETEQEPSTDINKPIARNLKKIFIKVPLKNESVIGYNFSVTTR